MERTEVFSPAFVGLEMLYEEAGCPGEAVGGTPMTKKRRRHSITGGSPEEVTGRIHGFLEHSGVDGQGHFLKEIMCAVSKMRDYVKNEFNKANKENRLKYFEKRFRGIEEYSLTMHSEYKRAREYAERIGSIERGFNKLVKKDWGTEMAKEVEGEVARAVSIMTERAKQVMDETLGRMSRS